MADIGGGALHLMDLGREAARAKVFKPRSRFGPVVVNAARAIGRFGRDAIAETRRPFDMAGPEIKVRPFDPGSVSTGAIASKALLSFMAGNRARANFRSEQAAKQAKAEQDAQIAASTISRNAAQAGYYDRGRTGEGEPTAYQSESLDLRRKRLEWEMSRPRDPRDPLTSAVLGLVLGGLRGEAGAGEAELEASDEQHLADLRARALSPTPDYKAVQELGIPPDMWRLARTQADAVTRSGYTQDLVDKAIARSRVSLKAKRRATSQSAGSAAVRAMLSQKVKGMPSVGGGGVSPWFDDALEAARAAQSDEE